MKNTPYFLPLTTAQIVGLKTETTENEDLIGLWKKKISAVTFPETKKMEYNLINRDAVEILLS